MKNVKLLSNVSKLASVFISALAVVFVFALNSSAQDKASAGETNTQDIFAKNGIKLVPGPARVQLGQYAEIDLPENFVFIGGDSIKKYYDLTENSYSGNEIGVVISRDGWEIFFQYTDSGHIDDSNRSELDADALYKQMEENQTDGNVERKKRGWDELVLKGWTSKPHYDEKTNNLTWAFRMASSQDNYKNTFINQNIRLLGRTGYVSAVVVGDDSADYAKTEAAANALLKNFHFSQGRSYAEFRSGDKVAKYGLAALVLGGAGAIAAKTGFLAKFAKFILLGAAAVGAASMKMLKKLFGKKSGGEHIDSNPNP
jgi:uncharacterized membrane-anchored protein